MSELFKSRGIFVLGDLGIITGSVNYKSGEISLDRDNISFKYDHNQTYHRLKISEIDQVFYIPQNNYIELVDILGLFYRYAPTSDVGSQAVIDMYKLGELANLVHEVKVQSKPIIIESEFDKKKILQDRIKRVIKEREIREKQQFKKQMEIINEKLANEKVKKLAKVLAATSSIKIEIIMEVLKIDSSLFYSDILPIAVDFGFTLDGEKLIYSKISIPEFIYKITNYFFFKEKEASGTKLTIKGPKPKPKKGAKDTSKTSPVPTEQTEEEKRDLEETEQEVSVQREKFLCVVHKGPIEGDNYLCPSCFTFYCLKCAKTLKKSGENCWTCGTEFRIESTPDITTELMDKVQKLEDKRNSLKKTAIDLDESFYSGAIDPEDYKQMKDKLVEKILKLNAEIAQLKEEKFEEKVS